MCMKELARVEKRELRDKVKRLEAFVKADPQRLQDYYDFDNRREH